MEYRVDSIIKFHPTSKLKLGETLSFSSPSRAQVALNSVSNDNLSVQIILEADDPAAAKEMAKIELDRISNLLSYFHDVPLERSSITRMSFVQVDAEGKQITVGEAMFGIDAILSVVKELSPKSAEELRHHLEKEYSLDFTDIISWWKVAISLEEPTLKYIFLYSLMEYLFSDKTKELTDWIKKREPLVEMHQPNEYRHYCYTNYTYLRDSLHHRKAEGFPRQQDINKLLPKFQDFVRDRIKETHGIDYA